jgi:hypothetical protein
MGWVILLLLCACSRRKIPSREHWRGWEIHEPHQLDLQQRQELLEKLPLVALYCSAETKKKAYIMNKWDVTNNMLWPEMKNATRTKLSLELIF